MKNQMDDLTEAAKLAGLDVQQVIKDSITAALEVGNTPEHNWRRYLMVFEYGGGKMNVNIVQVQDNYFRTLATYGGYAQGKQALDLLIMKNIKRRLGHKMRVDVFNNKSQF